MKRETRSAASTIGAWSGYPGAVDPLTAFGPDLPGADLVSKGLDDLRRGTESIEALLVSIGRPRLLQLGFDVPLRYDRPEIRLYKHLSLEEGANAHSRYNALIRRLVSFERAAECAR
ncbi:MAG: hypothetical protein ACREMK_10540 [Gemmatimonadota bacterium]